MEDREDRKTCEDCTAPHKLLKLRLFSASVRTGSPTQEMIRHEYANSVSECYR